MTLLADITHRLLGMNRIVPDARYLVFSKRKVAERYAWEDLIWSDWSAEPPAAEPNNPYAYQAQYLEVSPAQYATVLWSVSRQAWVLSLCEPRATTVHQFMGTNTSLYRWEFSTALLPSWVLVVPGIESFID